MAWCYGLLRVRIEGIVWVKFNVSIFMLISSMKLKCKNKLFWYFGILFSIIKNFQPDCLNKNNTNYKTFLFAKKFIMNDCTIEES